MGTVILKTCGVVRRGKSRGQTILRSSQGPALSPGDIPRPPEEEGTP